MGTFSSGLLILNTENNTYKQISSKNGICNNSVASITKDNEGYFWVGTYKGVAVVNGEGKLLKNLYEADDLVNNECNRHSAKLMEDGSIALGTIDGISLIELKEITADFEKENEIKTYLTSITYFDPKIDDVITRNNGFKNLDEIV